MRLFLLGLVFVASASARSEPWCRCAAFVTYKNSEVMVYEAPEITITSCEDEANTCRHSCTNELNEMSNNGDLWAVQESGETVGQYICKYLADHYFFSINNHKVYGYNEVCGGAWEFTGVESQQMLCCEGGEHKHCISA